MCSECAAYSVSTVNVHCVVLWSLHSGVTRAKYDGRHLAERCFSREAGAAFYVFVGKFTLADFH